MPIFPYHKIEGKNPAHDTCPIEISLLLHSENCPRLRGKKRKCMVQKKCMVPSYQGITSCEPRTPGPGVMPNCHSITPCRNKSRPAGRGNCNFPAYRPALHGIISQNGRPTHKLLVISSTENGLHSSNS